jgi:glycosyltransferase involved in cell wall biosynthesis
MDFAEVARSYDLPVRALDQQRPEVVAVSPLRRMAYRARRRLLGSDIRRLAYLDSTFPWERSGFRYHEALALLELIPDTMFFSLWELADPFPVQVHPLAEFPELALSHGVTDAYGVFQLFLAGLVGLHPTAPEDPHPMEGLDISRELRLAGIRLHGSIYPGGGLTTTPEGLEEARALSARLQTTFSYVPEVLENVAGVTPVAQAFTETRFYAPSDERWERKRPMVCVFAADQPPRKGLDVALRAFTGLSHEDFHLHVVGPHQHRSGDLSADLATFHGWLSPAELRDLHRRAHVFISPVSAEPAGPAGTFTGVTDGFPTQAAADAMSSGCLLISANPGCDHRVLLPGVHYIDCRPDPDLLRRELEAISRDSLRQRTIAKAGSVQVRDRMDIRRGVRSKLEHMGFVTPDITA